MAGSTLSIRPMAMAKIGQLMLDRGTWRGKRIVPAEWVSESTAVKALEPDVSTVAYGYKWWIFKYKTEGREEPIWHVTARGFGGQTIGMIPAYDLVVVTGGLDFGRGSESQLKFVREQILPALDNGASFELMAFDASDLGVVIIK